MSPNLGTGVLFDHLLLRSMTGPNSLKKSASLLSAVALIASGTSSSNVGSTES
jgi:hypothetical protein